MLQRYQSKRDGDKCIEPIKRLYECLKKENLDDKKCKSYRDALMICFSREEKTYHSGP